MVIAVLPVTQPRQTDASSAPDLQATTLRWRYGWTQQGLRENASARQRRAMTKKCFDYGAMHCLLPRMRRGKRSTTWLERRNSTLRSGAPWSCLSPPASATALPRIDRDTNGREEDVIRSLSRKTQLGFSDSKVTLKCPSGPSGGARACPLSSTSSQDTREVEPSRRNGDDTIADEMCARGGVSRCSWCSSNFGCAY